MSNDCPQCGGTDIPMIDVRVETENTIQDFKITRKAFDELAKAPHAGVAEYVFQRFARHVPTFWRLEVWDAVDQLAVKEEIAEQNRAVRARYGEDGTPLF